MNLRYIPFSVIASAIVGGQTVNKVVQLAGQEHIFQSNRGSFYGNQTKEKRGCQLHFDETPCQFTWCLLFSTAFFFHPHAR